MWWCVCCCCVVVVMCIMVIVSWVLISIVNVKMVMQVVYSGQLRWLVVLMKLVVGCLLGLGMSSLLVIVILVLNDDSIVVRVIVCYSIMVVCGVCSGYVVWVSRVGVGLVSSIVRMVKVSVDMLLVFFRFLLLCQLVVDCYDWFLIW